MTIGRGAWGAWFRNQTEHVLFGVRRLKGRFAHCRCASARLMTLALTLDGGAPTPQQVHKSEPDR
jgi:hypothetical protein